MKAILLLPTPLASKLEADLREIAEPMKGEMMEIPDSTVDGFFALADSPAKCPECRVRLKYFYLDDKWVCPSCGYVNEEKEEV